jgi:hypothetical protein
MKVLLFIAIAIVSVDRPTLSDDLRTLPKTITSAHGRVEASGRWVVTNRLNSTAPHIAQLNSVEIICNKAQGVCHEAIAALFTKDDVPQISWQFLTAVMSEFKIVRWDASGITAISAKPVADVELRIDVKAGTATRRHQERKARGSQRATPDVVVMWQLK